MKILEELWYGNILPHERDAAPKSRLDQLIIDELRRTKRMYQQNWDGLQNLIDRWIPQQFSVDEKLRGLSSQINTLEEEMEDILMERIRDKANAARYDRMIQKREAEIEALKKQIAELENIETVLKKRQSTLKRDIRLMDSILAEGAISEANLRLLVERIYISERDGKLDIDIHLKAPFRTHGMIYEDGEVVDAWNSLNYDWDRLGTILMEDDLEGENESVAILSAVQ